MRLLSIVFAVFLCFVPPSFAGIFNAQTETLDNGLQVILVPNERAPVVTQMLWYRIGGADEPAGQSGLTHFLEHLMFKGTEKIPSGEFSKRIAEIGGQDNAFTTHDSTTYYQSVARRYLPVVMAMEADRMRNLKLKPEDIESERKVVLQERGERYDNNPTGRFWEQVNERAFSGHPYARPIIGWKEEIEKLTPQQIIEYHSKWYVPNNAILVVSGDVTMDELMPLARKYYGDIKQNPELPNRTLESAIITRDKPEHLVKHDAQIQQAQWVRIYSVPSANNGNLKQADALTILADVLGSGATSLIYKELVVNKKIAAQASVSYNGINRGVGQFGVTIIPLTGVSMDVIEKTVDTFLDNCIAKGISADEIQRSKQRIITSVDYARDSLDGPPSIIGESLITGLNLSSVENFSERISSVDTESVQQALKDVVMGNKNKRFYFPLTAYLLPEKP